MRRSVLPRRQREAQLVPDLTQQGREGPDQAVALTTLPGNCLDGRFEMLPILHVASPNGEMFACDRCAADHGKIIRRRISRVCGQVRHSWPWVQWINAQLIGHSDGGPAESPTTPLSVRAGRAMPFRPCCGKLCGHAIDAERWDQGARGTV